MDISKISFSEQYFTEACNIVIRGLRLNHEKFDPFAKIWALLRRRFKEWISIDVAGVFFYDNERLIINCNFYLSFADGEARKNIEVFEKNAPMMMQTFEETVIAFLEDEKNGIGQYAKLCATNSAYSEYVTLFNRFLKSINLRTERDDRQAKKQSKSVPAKKTLA